MLDRQTVFRFVLSNAKLVYFAGEKGNDKNKGRKIQKKGMKPKKGRKSKNKKGSTISRVQKSRFLFKILGNHISIDRS